MGTAVGRSKTWNAPTKKKIVADERRRWETEYKLQEAQSSANKEVETGTETSAKLQYGAAEQDEIGTLEIYKRRRNGTEKLRRRRTN